MRGEGTKTLFVSVLVFPFFVRRKGAGGRQACVPITRDLWNKRFQFASVSFSFILLFLSRASDAWPPKRNEQRRVGQECANLDPCPLFVRVLFCVGVGGGRVAPEAILPETKLGNMLNLRCFFCFFDVFFFVGVGRAASEAIVPEMFGKRGFYRVQGAG